MRILEVSLKNVKSYRDGPEVTFHPGINFISGRNGTGKTTLLEAIGYALFDHKNYAKASSMLRIGEKSGRIDVTFILDDDVLYTVSRNILSRGTGSWVIREKGSELEIASGEDKVKSWIAEHLNISEGMDMAQMYSQIIGVPQGEITTYYKGTEKDRQKHFDPLMGTEGYIEAFKNSSNVEGIILMEMADLGAEIARLEERCKDFESEKEELDRISNSLKELIENQRGAKEKLGRLNDELAKLKALKDELTDLDKKITKLGGECDKDLALLNELEINIGESQRSGAVLKVNQVGHEKYLQATASIKELEPRLEGKTEKEAKLSELREAVANGEGENNAKRVVLQTESRDVEQELARLTKESEINSKDLTKLAEDDESLKALEERQDSLDDALEELEDIRLGHEQKDKELIDKKKLLDSKALKKKKLKEEVESAPDLEKIMANIQKIDDRLEERNGAIGSLGTKIAEYHELQGNKGKCPVTGQPCNDIDPIALKEKISKARESIISAEDEVKKLKAAKKELERSRKEAEKGDRIRLEISELEEEMVTLKEEMSVLTAEDIDKAINAGLKEWKQLYVGLGNKPTIPARGKIAIKAYLEKLMPYISQATEGSAERVRGLRSEMDQRVGTIKATRKQIDEDLKKGRAKVKQNHDKMKQLDKSDIQLAENKKEIASLDNILAGFVSLEKALAQARRVQTENAESYKEYETNKKMALKLDAYLKQKEELGKIIDAHKLELNKAKQRVGAINALYSEEQFVMNDVKKTEVVAFLAGLGKELEAKNGEKTALQSKLEGIEKDLVTLREYQQRTRLLEKVSQISKSIRNVLNEAGPLVAKRYREVVSEIANNIFRSIHPERAELAWDDGYLITLQDARGEREFNQLSGGEQMTAALAVQLALAKEFSDLGVAMFDEPTTNMDKERRGDLAKIIGQLKETYGFEQLFVISHDEAFETMTEQVIRLEKEDGTTRLVTDL